MVQIVFLVLVLGLIRALQQSLAPSGDGEVDVSLPDGTKVTRSVDREGPAAGEGQGESADGALETEGATEDGGASPLGDVDAIGIATPSPPAPFEERPELLAEAAAAESQMSVWGATVEHLIHRARARPEDVAAEPTLSSIRGDETWFRLREKPNLYRGKLVELRGNFIVPRGRPGFEIDTQATLPFDAPSGITAFWRSYVLGEEGKLYLLLSGERPTTPLSHMDGVRVRGFFAQLYHYETEVAGRPAQAVIPLIAVATIEPLPMPPRRDNPNFAPLYWLVFGGALIAGSVVLIVSWRSNLAYKRRREAKGAA